jgi:mannosyltransferase
MATVQPLAHEKRLVVDSTIFDLQLTGGISRYWYELVSNLISRHVDWRVALFLDPNTKNNFGKRLYEAALGRPNVAIHKYPWRAAMGRFFRPHLSSEHNKSLWHSSYYRNPDSSNLAVVCTVHDFIHERYFSGTRAWLHNWQKGKAILGATEIICVSESTKRDLLQFYPQIADERCHIIYHGSSGAFRAPLSVCASSGGVPYIMFVGTRIKYKNFVLAVRAVQQIPNINFYIVGGGRLTKGEVNLLKEYLPNRYQVFDGASDETLCTLYQGATALVYLSRCEGFGFPPLEAMACGCPVIAMATSSIPEVVGEAGILLQRENVIDVVDAIRGMANPELRARLIHDGFRRARRFSWDRAVDKTLEVYEKALNQIV